MNIPQTPGTNLQWLSWIQYGFLLDVDLCSLANMVAAY